MILEEEDITEGLHVESLSIVACLHTGHLLNLDGFKTAVGKAWQCSLFSMQCLDDQLYQIFFALQEKVYYVLHNGPSNFENNLLLIRPRVRTCPLHLAVLTKQYFWVLLRGCLGFVILWKRG